MPPTIDELLARIRALQDELEDEYRKAREEFGQKRTQLADEFLRQQRRYRVGLLRFVGQARPLVALTAPLIYAGWIPFLLLDLFVSVYQAVCFPIYRIPKVRRADYLVFDRADLPYLNLVEKFNCFYCSYGNGIAAYTREVAARTEQYWCPIKHARRVEAAHGRYPRFFDYGDAEAFRQGLERLRSQYVGGERK
ncbi:MAG: hypothetical protein JNK59_09135 [Sterolibacteriaceae bacterium]|nr:hypothetical protein [Sterolibacteriaceae bacterium]